MTGDINDAYPEPKYKGIGQTDAFYQWLHGPYETWDLGKELPPQHQTRNERTFRDVYERIQREHRWQSEKAARRDALYDMVFINGVVPDLSDAKPEVVAYVEELARQRMIIKVGQQEAAAGLSLPFKPIEEALEGVSADVEWILPGYIAKGSMTLFNSQPKTGKSTWFFAWLHAMQDSKPFFGLPTHPVPTLVLTEERSATFKQKHVKYGIRSEYVHVLMRSASRAMPWAEIIKEVTIHMQAHDTELLILDSYFEWTSLADGQENDTGATNTALGPMKVLTDLGVAVLIVHHDRKQHGSAIDMSRGSGALAAAVDLVVQMKKGKGNIRTLSAFGRFEETPEKLSGELRGVNYVPVTDAEVERQLYQLEPDDSVERVLAAVEGSGVPVTLKDVVAVSKVGKHRCKAFLDELVAAGKIGTGKQGRAFVWNSPLPEPLGVAGRGENRGVAGEPTEELPDPEVPPVGGQGAGSYEPQPVGRVEPDPEPDVPERQPEEPAQATSTDEDSYTRRVFTDDPSSPE